MNWYFQPSPSGLTMTHHTHRERQLTVVGDGVADPKGFLEGGVGAQLLAVGRDGELDRDGAATGDEDLEGVATADEPESLNVHDAEVEGFVGEENGFRDRLLHRARYLRDLLPVHKHVHVAVGAMR